MKIEGMYGAIDVALNEGEDKVLVELLHVPPSTPLQLDEHGVNFLVKQLQSMAEDMKRHREYRETERLADQGRL